MSNQDNKRGSNRPTDPFGGPSNRGNTVSIGFALVALLFFLVLQWTNGDIGDLLESTNTTPLANTGNGTTTPQVAIEDDEDETPAAEVDDDTPAAQATSTREPAATPQPATAQARDQETPRATSQPTPTANAPPAARASDLPTIAYEDLPPEAHDTIELIDQNGPFPFSRDGVTFQNRERILPRQPAGYYREYTVITPGSSDRGARRIVAGEEGEMYYTDDHYDSFREILR